MTTVRTSAGTVRGVESATVDGVSAFLGIPYAANGSGDDRFAGPVPFPAWPGERDATGYGPTPPQPHRGDLFASLDLTPFFGPGWVPGSPSLTVNVWTPGAEERLPVLVFVHGGAFVAGSSAASLYDGATFARDGVVCVTLNYRLGAPGWLHLPDAPENRGLLDVLAALTWVRSEIAGFGGDPGRVTLAGQSAGAMLVAAALADERFAGLFRSAVVASGSGLGGLLPAQAGLVTGQLAAFYGIEPTVEAFGELQDDDLLDGLAALAGLDLRLPGVRHPLGGLAPFAPVLGEQPATTIAAGGGLDVPLLIGTCMREGNLYTAPTGVPTTEAEALAAAALASPGGADGTGLLAAHRSAAPDADWDDLRSTIITDAAFRDGSRALADASAAAGRATYEYEFAWPSTAVGGRLGAAHGVDLPFWFDRADADDLRGPTGLLGPDGGPAALAAEMHGTWLSFVRDGRPGWDATSQGRPVVRRFG
ncbi:carboxylesterase/lipase family protein [Kineosporia sp. J2-2]|uniref:Carboxylic ester hydrolase n=1 Tax=Kineosporia corallincola TaxID=2835133 RepID=A0ABS5TDG7_9ACTN|nr:carboxylesterase family protein [Kineosporia corallincola]MBT0769126.1 carboxylesterase/lipase family protein [Kineosporia corallincola]